MSCNTNGSFGWTTRDLNLSNLSAQKAVVCQLDALGLTADALQDEIQQIDAQIKQVFTLAFDDSAAPVTVTYNLTPPASDVVVYKLENTATMASDLTFNMDSTNSRIGDQILIMVDTSVTGSLVLNYGTNLFITGCGSMISSETVPPSGGPGLFRTVVVCQFDGVAYVNSGDNC
jgi:hypothetical protein